MSYSYLASPYSVLSPVSKQVAMTIRDRRYRKVCRKAAALMKEGKLIFCPIAHSHPIEVIGMGGEIMTGDFWLEQDLAILEHASELLVYKMDGWHLSSGVKREIAFAEAHDIPVVYLEDESFGKREARPSTQGEKNYQYKG